MKPSRQTLGIGKCLWIPLLLAICGCVKESNVNGEHVYQYELWVPLSVLLGGLVMSPVGWLLRKKINRFGWAMVVGGPICVIFLAPSLFRDRVIVGDDHFAVRTGLWAATSVHEVKFDDVQQIRVTMEKTTGRRGRTNTNYYFICDKKAGGSSKVPMNNKLTEAAAAEVLQKARARGIPIRDETGGE